MIDTQKDNVRDLFLDTKENIYAYGFLDDWDMQRQWTRFILR